VTALCAFALLATSIAVAAQPTTATGLSSQISGTRHAQSYAESLMRAQDGQITHLKAQLKTAWRRAKAVRKKRRRAEAVYRQVRISVRQRRARVARVEAFHASVVKAAQRYAELQRQQAQAQELEAGTDDPVANPPANLGPAPDPAAARARVMQARRDLQRGLKRQAIVARRSRRAIRADQAARRAIASLKRQQRTAVSRRESAEAVLGANIVRMINLAGSRAELKTDAVLSSRSSLFAWPSVGRIAQTYGCTGYRLNPRRGSCRHFHDGLDIVSGYGSAVRSAAVGVVAYSGWNPWDQRDRAWVTIVVHPDGYVSRYGHLVPSDKVRVGELVDTGQIIGKMGNTGKATGTHLHLELERRGNNVNPLHYLPAGVAKFAKPKSALAQDKARARKANAKKARLQKIRAQKVKARKARAVKAASEKRKPAVSTASSSESELASVTGACEPTSSGIASTQSGALPYLPVGSGSLDACPDAEVPTVTTASAVPDWLVAGNPFLPGSETQGDPERGASPVPA
jgi:murein DD-endopeptidase MepM/ murein hydrolase activator NlpD